MLMSALWLASAANRYSETGSEISWHVRMTADAVSMTRNSTHDTHVNDAQSYGQAGQLESCNLQGSTHYGEQ